MAACGWGLGFASASKTVGKKRKKIAQFLVSMCLGFFFCVRMPSFSQMSPTRENGKDGTDRDRKVELGRVPAFPPGFGEQVVGELGSVVGGAGRPSALRRPRSPSDSDIGQWP